MCEISMYDEFIADYLFELDFPFGLPDEYWTTAQGERIRVMDMTSQHIRNCMRVVGEDDAWYAYFRKELDRRANDEHID